MPRLFRRAILALMSALAGFGSTLAADSAGTTRIDLIVDEAVPNRRVPWPVTTGVPFPQGKLVREEQCRLIDDRGEVQPLQSRVAATWDAQSSSIRWLTIDFMAVPGRRYALEFGPDVRRKAFPEAIEIREGNSIEVATGRLRAEWSRNGAAALRRVLVDLNDNGRIESDEQVAAGAADGDHALIDQNGVTSSSSRDGEDRTVVVETTGPVRCCVRVDGWYTNPAGRRIVRYRTRYHLFAGLPLLKIVDEFRPVESTRDIQFRDIAYMIDLTLDRESRRVTVGWGDDSQPEISVPWRPATKSVSLAQETYRHYGNLDCRAVLLEEHEDGERRVQAGERAGAWMQASDRRASVTGSLRWFWQQFPKEWQLSGNRLSLHLWSPRGGTLDFGEAGLKEFFGPAGQKYLLNWEGVRGTLSPIENFFYFAGRHALERDGADGLGINKHHEAWFHFAPAAETAAGREYGALADRPPLCLASGAWNVSTGVFGPLAARPNDSPDEAIVDRVFELERYAQDAFGDYGWWLFGAGPHYSYQWDAKSQRHYADPRRFEYHTYQRETQLWWCYLRSGERKFYDWAVPSENHWVDVAVSHVPTQFSTQWRGGAPGDARLHFPAGDWSIDSPLHYVRHHDTGEAWLRSASQFWATYHRTLETTTLAYYLSGDERYNDVLNLWKEYWSPLAGVRSDSADVRPWHREQMWFEPTPAGKPSKSWAEMLRDYAPFQSGSRHQMTLLFNLSTLYEHTWDPEFARVLREYADAFLDPDSPNGVWQCHDHRLPANADSPLLAHYWSPALWKYARASNDPRMPEVLKKYFTACYEADPYGGDVGVYSNAHIAWAWHFTRDPRSLIAARRELDDLKPSAAPLARPEDLGSRIYNPYEPIRALAAVPRLIGALEEARQAGIEVPPPPPLAPQRALIAVHRRPNEPLRAVLWGWDKEPQRLDDAGRQWGTVIETLTHRSHRQPFDRVLPGFQVFRSTVESPAVDGTSWSFLSPRLETGILELKGADAVWCWAGEPLRIEPRQKLWWRRHEAAELTIETANPSQLRLTCEGKELPGKVSSGLLTVPVGHLTPGTWVSLEATAEAWVRLSGIPEAQRWICTTPSESEPPPSSLVGRRASASVDPAQTYVPGKFGQALLIVPGRELRIPNELVGEDGESKRLADPRQGTLEFWIRRLTDDRLTPSRPWVTIENAPLVIASPPRVPLEEWTHIAVVWRPVEDMPDRSLVHLYVNGRDHATYRNLRWAGYAAPPQFDSRQPWKSPFVIRGPPGVRFAVDDLRISSAARYVDLGIPFGSHHTWNPSSFPAPDAPAAQDGNAVVLLPLDGSTSGTGEGNRRLDATLVRETR